MGALPMKLIYAQCRDDRVVSNGNKVVVTSHISGPVTLGIRPEDVEIGKTCDILFTLDIVEELGAHRLLHGQLDGQDFTIHVGKGVAVSVGPTCKTINQDAVVLFNAETELVL